jgi:hypothetical protein
VKLSEAMKRHLIELVEAPYWNPASAGEWACARALERRGLVDCEIAFGRLTYVLNKRGQVRAAELQTT